MSDNTENVTVVGSVDGPRAKILEAIESGRTVLVDGNMEKLTMGNFVPFFGIDVEKEGPLFVKALVDLINRGEIHSQKGRNGGLKMGPKPAPTGKSASAMLLAQYRKTLEK